jgi:hypothetical protein
MATYPALEQLQFLVGDWDMELFGAAFLPDPETRVNGAVTFAWIEQGGALVMRQGETATWIIGRDEDEENFQVLYSDGRGVSRVYHMRLDEHSWTLWRHTAEFSQRFEAAISADRTAMEGRWEKSFDGGQTWEHDFNVNYAKRAAVVE